LLLLLVSPVGEVPVALLVLPAPLLSTDELDLAELPVPPELTGGIELLVGFSGADRLNSINSDSFITITVEILLDLNKNLCTH
jgi:hypothetical protein